ncbi:isochorismate synthase [Rubrobacter calidifluminis]|uniref:isochorismate synthase n=1 Tax=Rubrobacter calidifluminis TaxID=1392640 RepID=UPI0023611860|nr:isochorismate synthase [Rubrobacter calidifluminis]
MSERTREKNTTPEEALARIVARLPAGVRWEEEPRVVRLETALEHADPLRWLSGRIERPRIYWAARDGSLEIAASGMADVVGGMPEPAGILPRGARYYGGIRFDPGRKVDPEWEDFGSARFVLPRFELVREGERTVMACNLVMPGDATRLEEVARAARRVASEPEGGACGVALPEPVFREDLPGAGEWAEDVRRALSTFSAGGLEKVVLARRVSLYSQEDYDPLALLGGLAPVTPGCFRFLFEPGGGVAFVVASPERLFRMEGAEVVSEAVAGTRPRGLSESEDAGLRDELLGSEKDLREHGYVRKSIGEVLGRFCTEVEVAPGPEEFVLAQGRHLRSPIRGSLRAGVSPRDVLEALHPTPAVGGWPRDEAISLIRELEPFDRGWYAGPVGWVGAEDAEFAVGIRSALVRGNEVHLFSGNGIVEGSDPEREWDELEGKLGAFAKVLGFGPSG